MLYSAATFSGCAGSFCRAPCALSEASCTKSLTRCFFHWAVSSPLTSAKVRTPASWWQAPEAGEDHLAMGADGVAGRMLHPGIGGNDEESRKPRAEEHQQGGEPVRSEERRVGKECRSRW